MARQVFELTSYPVIVGAWIGFVDDSAEAPLGFADE
jgi:hypothetical protein